MLRAFFCTLFLAPVSATADPAVIVEAQARPSGDGWTVSVTLRHGDTGWDDYADGWRVVTAAGAVLGTRELLHPHVDEQPFTRSRHFASLPADVPLFVESSTTRTGWSGPAAPLTRAE